jgi:magnesium-transporting ATPase (P-type)
MRRDRSRMLPLLGAGFTVWAVGFVLVYGVQSYGCAAAWDTLALGGVTLQRAVVVGLALATLAGSVLVTILLARLRAARSADSGPAAFIRTTALATAAAGTAATFFTFAGVVALSPCA